MPKISVIMPTYNAQTYLKEAIDSILSQTFSDFELLVINDNSTDATLEILRSYDDERIRIIQGDCKGLPAALNKGILEANGEYIARMDADDISLPERFSKQVAFLETNPDISLVGSWQKYIGNNSWVHKTLETPEEVKIAMLFGCDLCHSTIMFRKNDFIKNNLLYDENSIQEDFELWSRAVHVLKFANIQEVLGSYRVTGSSLTDGKLNIIEDYEVSIVASQLAKHLKKTITKEFFDLLRCRSTPFYSKTKGEKTAFLRKLNELYQEIEISNQKYKVYNPIILHSYLCKKYTNNCHGYYLLTPSSYLKFNKDIILNIFYKMTKTNIAFSKNFSILQVLGLRIYKKELNKSKTKIVYKILGLIKFSKIKESKNVN